ncbi:hypothetical protein [Aneurinibacillus tyrosinisolvens]|uniref:hypothetical protein n=1 Tax=Aneurinibacillus tyrosinisolvens TaxID=1443435 RepID=UPI00063EE26F|nr:hypothetical protein [Aneurinibacillus tyrosinisolvens]
MVQPSFKIQDVKYQHIGNNKKVKIAQGDDLMIVADAISTAAANISSRTEDFRQAVRRRDIQAVRNIISLQNVTVIFVSRRFLVTRVINGRRRRVSRPFRCVQISIRQGTANGSFVVCPNIS